MSYKRSRATYEADLPAPYATFGTPLPDETEARDDGSFVPVWKQEVRDERGRKRLHGAFTGGWSAGYFNTVGSKEGWTPSTFVSSRANRHKDGKTNAQQPRPEDYMDDEDLADAAEAQKIQTSEAFAGLGSGTQNDAGAGDLMGLFKTDGDTIGLKLLRKMGWRDGQGVGPKVRRSARLDMGNANPALTDETYLFAPDNAKMIRYTRKNDRKGLGHEGVTKLTNPLTSAADDDDDVHDPHADDDDDDDTSGPILSLGRAKQKPKPKRGGIGVGILNDDGSDEEDPYEIGPKIKYNRVIGGDKKKKTKKTSAAVNPTLRNAPVFLPKTARAGNGLRRCHDGRLPLDGFVLGKVIKDLTNLLLEYAPPPIPEGWTSLKASSDGTAASTYTSTADAAKASIHDPKSRAAILGENSLPGKSVFDYLSSSARDRLAAGSGKQNLPQGLGEIPAEFALSEEEKQQAIWDQAPKLDRETAIAAISRGSTGPYADDEVKKSRYRAYLEYFATGNQPPPSKLRGTSDDDFTRELNEFHKCARIYKPMTGFMASRFTTAKTTLSPSAGATPGTELLSKPEPKITDPAEEAAKVGMYGTMTRSVQDFLPTRLLCKRFNVKPPAHSQQAEEARTPGEPEIHPTFGTSEATDSSASSAAPLAIEAASFLGLILDAEVTINPEKNDAVEGKAAHDEVLRAIFGESDSE